jgi:hypothetical protein
MKFRKLWVFLLALLGCTPKFVDTTVNGVPNLTEYAPDMWRMGQSNDATAWSYVESRIVKPGKPVLVVKLNDDNEGDDSPVLSMDGWVLDKDFMPPEDDKPWTVFVKPNAMQVTQTVKMIIAAHEAGWVVVHHCTHGRDRTSLIAALVQKEMFHWTKQQAWDDMIAHGFRWELPDLTAFWLEDVAGKPVPKLPPKRPSSLN